MDETVYPSNDGHPQGAPHDTTPPLPLHELSADDLAVLQAFYAMEDLEVGKTESETPVSESPLATQSASSPTSPANFPDDMLGIFASEAEEAIATMRRALEQLEQDDRLDSPGFGLLQRTAHKLKGTAGSIGYETLSTLAHHVETLVELVKSGTLIYLTGLIALINTIQTMEITLQGILTDGQESRTLLTELEENFAALNIDMRASHTGAVRNIESTSLGEKSNAGGHKGPAIPSHPHSLPPLQPLVPSVRVDVHRLEQLVQYSEQLLGQRTPLENAQKQVEAALEELHAAQVRLRSLEALFTGLPFSFRSSKDWWNSPLGSDELMNPPTDSPPASSLVARILNEAAQRRATATEGTTGEIRPTSTYLSRKSRRNPAWGAGNPYLLSLQNLEEAALWDELEVDRYTESNLLAHSLSEAIADVATASGQLRIALAQFNSLVEQHMAQATLVQSGIHLLRSAPLSTLLPRLQRAIQMSANAQQKQALFEVKGETTEIDQDILEALANPLLQLVRNCSADHSDGSIASISPGHDEHPYRIWLYADAIGNEVTIEIGFSKIVQGGALDTLHEPISRLHGSVSAQRNAEGGISFHLRFPRSQGAVQGLLVRVGNSRVVVPFSQVQRIDYGQQKQHERLYVLSDLLNFPIEQLSPEAVRPVMILQFNGAVQVDEILGNVQLVMKPLAAHLQRPGIAGSAIDGIGNVLLILDIPELVRRWEALQSDTTAKSLKEQKSGRRSVTQRSEQASQKILVADDSVYIRQSLHQTLSHAGYSVMEARDGMEAMEQLLDNPPDLLLLDIEMPNLNGYDLLSIIRGLPPTPQLAMLKIVMLTSRSSQKHQQRALELGAHAYLPKPCPQETLLETISSLLR